MGKQNSVIAYNVIFTDEKKWSPDVCYNIDKHVKWKKPDVKFCITLYKMSRRAKFIETETLVIDTGSRICIGYRMVKIFWSWIVAVIFNLYC